MGVIFNIQRYCLHDGDGIRTNVFFKGCPLRCLWCHNPEGLSPKPVVSYNREKCTSCGRCSEACPGRNVNEGQLSLDRSKCVSCGKCVESCLNGANEIFGRTVTADDVLSEVLRDKVYYKTSGGGMTLSGGEPSFQPEFALELIEKAKNEGVYTSVETCGMGSEEFYVKAFELGATFLYDVKCVDSKKHRALTGVGNERILSNLHMLLNRGADVIIRLPLIPNLNDTPEDIDSVCDLLSQNAGKYRYAEIMPYHTFGIEKARRLGNTDVFVDSDATADDKARWQESFLKRGIDVKISK